MNRGQWIKVAAMGLLLFLVGRWFVPFQATHETPTSPRTHESLPPRLPELFGTVEKIHKVYNNFEILVRCRQPPPTMPESDQNKWHRQLDEPHVWVLVFDRTKIYGQAPEIAIGQTISAWCSGEMLTTNPPKWGGDFVVIERNGP